MPQKASSLSKQDLYQEIGNNYRFFLNWRHALFAGYLVILYTLANAYAWALERQLTPIEGIIIVGGVIITLTFWALERRIRALYRACTSKGKEIEGDSQLSGIYHKLDNQNNKENQNTHSLVLDIFFGTITLLLGFYFLAFLYMR